MTNPRTIHAVDRPPTDSILITPERQAAQDAEEARRASERIRHAHEFRESLTSDFDRELFLGKSMRDNPYGGALLGAATAVPTRTTGSLRDSGSGYAGRAHTPSYGSVAQVIAEAATAVNRMTPED